MITLKKIILICLVFFIFYNTVLFSQEVPQPINNYGIYEFLDEMANIHVVNVNSSIKPYSRQTIAELLKEASDKKDLLNNRQKKELDFYLMDFGKELNEGKKWNRRKDLFYYKDDLFSLTINPIGGAEIFSNFSSTARYWRNGAEARGYIKKWGFYASLRDNHENPLLGKPEYLIARNCGHIKGTSDWSEMTGGITYSWDWGNAGLIKEKQQWGDNYYGSNIFSGNNPSFVQLRLQINPVKWFSFNYFHGWLNSMVVDSSDSYWVRNSYGTDYREVYHKKYIAANMFTFIPLRGLYFSAGNSIIYNDENVNPAYLIPIFFYKSVDHSLTSGIDNMNSQMYFDISSRQIRNLHLYATLFIDELSVSRFRMNDQWNFLSYKAGFRLSNFLISNISLTTEFTYTYPLTFQHYVPTLTFETSGFNLGHYLKDNSKELYSSIDFRPLRTMTVSIFITDAVRGPDYTSMGGSRIGNPPLKSIEWHKTVFGIKTDYQIINDLYIWASIIHNEISGNSNWSSPFFYGEKNILNAGFTFGF
jgi:hypothetical protein